jgi:hypothetical protein
MRARVEKFREQKGPDFVSRLRGHINIQSVNCFSNNVKPIIRRAMTLRGLIEQRHLVTQINEHPGVKIAEIDDEIVYAMLTIDHYRHGTRSIEAILQMCSPIEGRIEKASLPSRAQLNMHVSADEFIIRMYRGRFRPSSSNSSASPNETSSPQGPTSQKTGGHGPTDPARGPQDDESLGDSDTPESGGGDKGTRDATDEDKDQGKGLDDDSDTP